MKWKEFVENNIVVAPDIALKPGQMLMTSDPKDPSKSVLITNVGNDEVHTNSVIHGNVLVNIEPSVEDTCLTLLMRLVITARNGNKEEYKATKKEIKKLMDESPIAKKFIKDAMKSMRV